MKIGTKSILFGVHQFMIHPLLVLWAWWIIYRRFPRLYELCAIFTHDLGYWGLSKMDDEKGVCHPEVAADWWFYKVGEASSPFCFKVSEEIQGHSRFYVTKHGGSLSPLFRADKLAIALCPRWLYLLLANLSGEIHEYMEIASTSKDNRHLDTSSQTRWLLELQAHMIILGLRGNKNERNQI